MIPKIQYDPRVTLGNILSGLTMLAAVAALWTNLNVRLTQMEMRQEWTTQIIRRNEDVLLKTVGAQEALGRQADRLVTIIDLIERGRLLHRTPTP